MPAEIFSQEHLSRVIYVERLTLRWLWEHAFRFIDTTTNKKFQVFFIDHGHFALIVAQGLSAICPVTFREFQFQCTEPIDKDGISIRLKVTYKELAAMGAMIYRDIPAQLKEDKGLALYLMKSPVSAVDVYSDGKYLLLRQAVTLVNFVRWHVDQMGTLKDGPQLYLFQRSFFPQLGEYAETKGITLGFMKPYRSRAFFLQKAGKVFFKLNGKTVWSLLRHVLSGVFRPEVRLQRDLIASDAKILVESRWEFNISHPERMSDLFFLENHEGIRPEDVLLVFNGSFNPVKEDSFKAMREAGIEAVALTPQSSLVSEVPVFLCDKINARTDKRRQQPGLWDEGGRFVGEYTHTRSYWESFFKRYNIKLWTSFYKNEPEQISISDALRAVGGVSTIYQRSYEPNATIITAVSSDIIFSFSKMEYDIEVHNGSEFRYHIATGYLGDCRFGHLKQGAGQLRERLGRSGAKHIIAYFDEITIDDGRWFFDHHFIQRNYAFWLERLLANPGLGLIFKPKSSNTLRRRLGKEVAGLLSAAEETGRCYVFEETGIFSLFSPAAASLASDIAIHENFSAGTAGLESALAGTRTILMDFEGWPLSPLYKLGDEVVFKDWESVWVACQEYFNSPASRPRLGDWSAMIDELDPFHDGLAAHRMSGYLKEVLEGLRQSQAPSDVMDRASENYARRWGKDMVRRGPSK